MIRFSKFIIILLILLIIIISIYNLYNVQDTPENTDSKNSNISNNSTNVTFKNFTYEVLNTYPHDKNAFTQGLVYDDGVLYEGTGLRGQSSLRKVELETGNILQIHNLSSQFFGEGITIFGNRIIQLTWQSKIGFVYNKDTFELIQEFNYSTEGWGITHDGNRLIMSDGSETLYFLHPETFEVVDQIKVYNNSGPITKLNELEYIHGEIYANVWQMDQIVKIDPKSGQVTGWITLTGLLTPEEQNAANVLNGIAYDAEVDRLFVTGKRWPKMFEIELVPVD